MMTYLYFSVQVCMGIKNDLQKKKTNNILCKKNTSKKITLRPNLKLIKYLNYNKIFEKQTSDKFSS